MSNTKQEVPATPSAIGVLLAWGTTQSVTPLELDVQKTQQEVVHLASSNCKNTLREWKEPACFSWPFSALS